MPVGLTKKQKHSIDISPADLDIMRSLGFGAYRFSIEWSRIEPEEGEFSAAALDHYARVIDACHERDMQAVVTFHHFTTPRWAAAGRMPVRILSAKSRLPLRT